jgi:adenylate cyclase class IV
VSRNIEIKARIPSVAALIPQVASIADQGPIEIVQDDTFFRCQSGRLKLRTVSQDQGELIFYRRALAERAFTSTSCRTWGISSSSKSFSPKVSRRRSERAKLKSS